MTARHSICCTIVAIYVALAGQVRAEEVAAIPADEHKAMVSLVDELVRLGLPDTAGGEYFVGPAYVQQQFDPAKEEPVVPFQYAQIQETVPESTEMIYKSIVPGPHFRLADGRWLLSLGYLVTPSERQQVFTAKMEKRELGSLLKDAAAAHPFQPNDDFDDWFKRIPADDREAMKAGVRQGVPLWQYLQLPRNNTTLGVCFLLRAGASDAEVLCYTIADTRCRNYWRMQPWTGPAAPFDPTGRYEGFDQLEQEWDADQQTYAVEPLSVAFRRDLHRYFSYMLTRDDGPCAAKVAAALARATLDEGDPQQLEAKIDALLASTELPRRPAADADLAAVLQSWGEPGATMVVTNSSTADKPGITTEFRSKSADFSPTRADLPGLFALLDDSRPTRWIDYDGCRSVGENALRAIAIVLEKNPFVLVDQDTLSPWTEESRRSVNDALRKWWNEHQAEYAAP